MSKAPITSGAACSSGCPCGPLAGAIGTLARIALGALFIFSGIVKLNDPQAFAFAIKGFKLVESHNLIVQATFSIPWTEVLVGALLVVGLFTRAAAGALLAMLAIFTGAIISVIARGIDTTCGCFGNFLGAEIDWNTVLRNSVLIAMTVIVLVKDGGYLTLDRFRQRSRPTPDQPA